MTNRELDKIDFVITWVDSQDINWKKNRSDCANVFGCGDSSEVRFRDWEILKYWFRSVAEHANWVNKIYLVTCGQKPSWLNTENKKIIVVDHKDIIEEKNLPTFNSCVIENNMHKINGLSEKFVYFNDDMFLNKNVNQEDFFKNGKPLDNFILTPINAVEEQSAIIHYNCMKIINKNFDFKNVDRKKKYSLKNGKYIYKNVTLSVYPFNVGMRFHHLPTSLLKSTFEEVWEKEGMHLNITAKNKFRMPNDTSQWLFQFWQLASNEYEVRDIKIGKYYDLMEDFGKVLKEILNPTYKLICLNDNSSIQNFEEKKKLLLRVFENRYPKKSSFEH